MKAKPPPQIEALPQIQQFARNQDVSVATSSACASATPSPTPQQGPLNVWKVGTCEMAPPAAPSADAAPTPPAPTPSPTVVAGNGGGDGAKVPAASTAPVADGPVIVKPMGLRPASSQNLALLQQQQSEQQQIEKDLSKIKPPTPESTPTPSASVNAPGNYPRHNNVTTIGNGSTGPTPSPSRCHSPARMTSSMGHLRPPSAGGVPIPTPTPTPPLPPSMPAPSPGVESVLASACIVLEFDIAEVWLRTGPKTHRLVYTHLRPSALSPNMSQLVDVYYGARSAERTHRLSPALCKGAKEARDVVWVTARPSDVSAGAAYSSGAASGAATAASIAKLENAISDVRTAVAVPVCHEALKINMTVIFFSMRRAVMRPPAVEFLVHMSLAAAVASVNHFPENIHGTCSQRATVEPSAASRGSGRLPPHGARSTPSPCPSLGNTPPPSGPHGPNGISLNLKWGQLQNVEYLTDGSCAWIHTAVYQGRTVCVKTLKPECQDLVIAINEIEDELAIHSLISHHNIANLVGAGVTSRGMRFLVIERLDGGTLTQVLGYDTRIRDRRRRFARRKQLPYVDVLKHAKDLASAFAYLHEGAVEGAAVLHRDLKPDNVGFSIDGSIKLIDFGLAKVLHGADPTSDEVYEMSGETGSLRYMAPEVALSQPYNHKADVYSFGILIWELITYKKPFESLGRESFYRRVVYGGERPPIHKKWPAILSKLLTDCWSPAIEKRPSFDEIVLILGSLMNDVNRVEKKARVFGGLIDRHSTWF